jgi:hypothetical protein
MGGSDCVMYLVSSDRFDIFLVDERWKVTKARSAAQMHTSTSTRR